MYSTFEYELARLREVNAAKEEERKRNAEGKEKCTPPTPYKGSLRGLVTFIKGAGDKTDDEAAIWQYFGTSVGQEMMGILRGLKRYNNRSRGVTVLPLKWGMPKAGWVTGRPTVFSNASWMNLGTLINPFNSLPLNPNSAATFGHEIAHLFWPKSTKNLDLDRFGMTRQKYAISQGNRVRTELCIDKRPNK